MFHFVHVLLMAGPIFQAVFPTFGIKPRNNKKTWKKLSTRSWLESDEFPINLTVNTCKEKGTVEGESSPMHNHLK